MSLLDELRAVVGDAHVLTDPDLRAPFERDWTGRFGADALAVVRPADTEQVSAVVRVCAAHDVALVPQGGNTGLVGGGVPRGGEVVLSLTRLNTVAPVDPALRHVLVGAGATLAQLHVSAAAAGLATGLDFRARDSATLGGIVACNAGGARALRYGTARARVAGLEAVLADGTIISRLSGLAKDNAGVDLSQLLIGSEGTLGIITRVLWQLVPRYPSRVAALVPLPDIESASGLLAALTTHAPALEACELLTHDALSLSLQHQRRTNPVEDAPFYVFTELADHEDPTPQLVAAFEHAGIEDAAVADDTTSRERLWDLREGVAEAIASVGVPHKLDVGVPLAQLGAFLTELPLVVRAAASDARLVVFGHLGDGNLHVNVLDAGDHTDTTVDDAVLGLVLDHGGTISAEHGIGTAKAHWLERARPEYAVLQGLKAWLDPAGTLNPGSVLLRATTT
ncbi:FAD-binding oxidoreductase [Solirubrobacter phytolaccae]|uniref:FAD-binding oxidoreductase n=1 Tax=Solirubrobacter phytolaccae TaxID=1404360 RepID=A0A9X3N8T9_9ACTN|nr:FAD-binding oxidoreductase [Solirubrobacter phytolaccae]MDA0181928.1 FAD-binding oxidoreductase [Solirubrobacter phytolaccae]